MPVISGFKDYTVENAPFVLPESSRLPSEVFHAPTAGPVNILPPLALLQVPPVWTAAKVSIQGVLDSLLRVRV